MLVCFDPFTSGVCIWYDPKYIGKNRKVVNPVFKISLRIFSNVFQITMLICFYLDFVRKIKRPVSVKVGKHVRTLLLLAG